MWGSGRYLMSIQIASSRGFLNFTLEPEIWAPKGGRSATPVDQKIKKKFFFKFRFFSIGYGKAMSCSSENHVFDLDFALFPLIFEKMRVYVPRHSKPAASYFLLILPSLFDLLMGMPRQTWGVTHFFCDSSELAIL